jgi:hypothetical protein
MYNCIGYIVSNKMTVNYGLERTIKVYFRVHACICLMEVREITPWRSVFLKKLTVCLATKKTYMDPEDSSSQAHTNGPYPKPENPIHTP